MEEAEDRGVSAREPHHTGLTGRRDLECHLDRHRDKHVCSKSKSPMYAIVAYASRDSETKLRHLRLAAGGRR